MSTSVVFDLVDALVSRLTPLLEVNVFDGYGITDDPGDYLMIGVEDPDSDRATSAESKQEWAGLGARSRYEEGTITCIAMSWNGDGDLSAARAACKATTVAVEDHLRDDPNLGGDVTGLNWTGYGTRTELIQLQATDGACVMCVFDISFKARLTS
jgi:hypothetical protein